MPGVPAYTGRIVLEFETVEGSLLGCVTTSAGTEHQFAGWVGLLGTLQVLLVGDDPSAAKHPAPHTSG